MARLAKDIIWRTNLSFTVVLGADLGDATMPQEVTSRFPEYFQAIRSTSFVHELACCYGWVNKRASHRLDVQQVVSKHRVQVNSGGLSHRTHWSCQYLSRNVIMAHVTTSPHLTCKCRAPLLKMLDIGSQINDLQAPRARSHQVKSCRSSASVKRDEFVCINTCGRACLRTRGPTNRTRMLRVPAPFQRYIDFAYAC
jgi:hypothetical protein